MKQRNPQFGCPRIAQQINKAFGTHIDEDVVRRDLAAHYRPDHGDGGPSWLTFLGHTKDSLWSIDLFQCESILLKSHWVLIIMDQFTRRIIGFGVHAGGVDGIALCRLLNAAISTQGVPHYLSSDNDSLFRYHRWQANLRVLDVKEIKSVAYVPLSHPFVERLIGTIRREYLDQVLFWNAGDLERKPGIIPSVLQCPSCAHFTRWQYTIRNLRRNHLRLCLHQPIPVEVALPRAIPVTRCRLNNNSPYTGC